MHTKSTITFAIGLVSLLALVSTPAQAGWGVGIRIGGPAYYRPYYYSPYPTVIVDPAPFVVQPVPVIQQVPAVPAVPATNTVTPEMMPAPTEQQGQLKQYLGVLSDPSEQVRLDAVSHLGRLKSQRAVDPLAATLAGDSSAQVREAAARALALIGSRSAIPALKKAASSDSDRDVRHSAQFALDVVQSK